MSPKPITTTKGSLRVFRDDLYPFLGGGNKGRKMDAIATDIFEKGANALVTTGGIQSNHCRAVAVFAAQHSMQCTLVLHGSEDLFHQQSGNAKVMRLSGAQIVFVKEPSDIGPQMDAAMGRYRNGDWVPYYIWGGGHTLEGGKAYIDAVGELMNYGNSEGWLPEYIFHASGTGSTQAGILAGLDKYAINSKVIGISVGRRSDNAQPIVQDFYEKLCGHYQIPFSNRPSIVLDDYLCGGYGEYNQGIKDLCENSIRNYGFVLDTCYSGKAFYGMLDYIEKHKIDSSKVLFWHTGGVFNFLAD